MRNMKIIVFCLVAASFSRTSFSEEIPSDYQKVRSTLESEVIIKNSELNRGLQSLMSCSQIPSDSHFTLFSAKFLEPGNKQTFHECQQDICRAYERNFFHQFSEIRWTSPNQNEIRIWIVGITVSIYRVWNSDSEGSHLELINEEIHIPTINFF
jgi:hypothetical protein